MTIKGAVFDLDGTLLDTLATLAQAFNTPLTEMGYAPRSVDDFRYIIGDGARVAATRCLPDDARNDENIDDLTRRFQAYYADHWQAGTSPYPGIIDAVETLAGAMPLAVLSNKDEVFTAQCVAHFFESHHFRTCVGFSEAVKHKPDPSGANVIAGELGVATNELMMIGDTATDMRTAVACNMVAVGVLWGFRDEQELLDAGAQYLVSTPGELTSLALQLME